ncbi:hypothetical protein E2986_10381 [Frieseomelitta varia]|uniref:Uncharacterized protein n=1 Tax=Frieseomelitta varia TaxID=561572 RepID=A0A833S139_9HYME|nr:hypothetical protein E2986_10381 [Frieseomelitta varia]
MNIIFNVFISPMITKRRCRNLNLQSRYKYSTTDCNLIPLVGGSISKVSFNVRNYLYSKIKQNSLKYRRFFVEYVNNFVSVNILYLVRYILAYYLHSIYFLRLQISHKCVPNRGTGESWGIFFLSEQLIFDNVR